MRRPVACPPPGRSPRFPPGWWLLPAALAGGGVWAAAIHALWTLLKDSA